jgi:hypothetical protein
VGRCGGDLNTGVKALEEQSAKEEQRISSVEVDVRKNDNLLYRITVVEQANASVAKSLKDLKSSVSDLSGEHEGPAGYPATPGIEGYACFIASFNSSAMTATGVPAKCPRCGASVVERSPSRIQTAPAAEIAVQRKCRCRLNRLVISSL